MARLQLANALRAQRRQDRVARRLVATAPPPEVDDGTADAVRSTLARLRPADAEIIRLWAWEGLEPAQIATVLAISANAAAVRLHRARRRFAEQFRDPAAAVRPLRADQTIALAERAADAGARRAPAPRSTRPVLLAGFAAAAAAIAVIGAAVAIPLSNLPAPDAVTLEQVPGGIAAKCMAPDAGMIAESAEAMFRADVRDIAGGIVTLEVTETLAGEVASVVEVAQGDGMISDGGPLVFESGATYLLATSDGVILSCGLSGIASPELEALYADAARLQGE